MKDQTNKNKATSRKTPILILAAVLAVLTVGGWLTFSLIGGQKNLAQETAKPIETSLISMGASKVCNTGDNGKGADNKTPYYGATFTLTKDKATAVQLAEKVASDNGYTLKHASPSDRGFLTSVADAYINDWYFDETSKDNSYSELQSGKVKLSVVVYGEGAKNDCDQSIIQAGHSTIGVGIRLPDYK